MRYIAVNAGRAGERGMSLVELSVVIAVIALIISVLAGGVKIQKASFIQGVVSDISSYQSAFENFEQKYNSLPGDMEDATDYWEDETTDGDGNNRVEYATSGDNEALRAWQHLSLASLVSGGYTGESAGAAQQSNPGVNVPASKRKKTAYYIDYAGIGGASARNTLVIGAFNAATKNNASALRPEEAKAIDNKTDDALPEDGSVRAEKGAESGAPECVAAGNYDLSQDDFACIMSFPVFP